jgi:hypothetical protein
MESALRERLAPSELHHQSGHDLKPGSQTPSRAFGVDYILNFDGVVREDLNRRAARPNPPAICSLTFGHSSS